MLKIGERKWASTKRTRIVNGTEWPERIVITRYARRSYDVQVVLNGITVSGPEYFRSYRAASEAVRKLAE